MTCCTIIEVGINPKVGQNVTFTATITECDSGAAYDVTGAVVNGHYSKPDGTTGSSVGSIVDGPNGVVQWTTPLLDVVGRWMAEIDADGVRTSAFTWPVLDKIT